MTLRQLPKQLIKSRLRRNSLRGILKPLSELKVKLALVRQEELILVPDPDGGMALVDEIDYGIITLTHVKSRAKVRVWLIKFAAISPCGLPYRFSVVLELRRGLFSGFLKTKQSRGLNSILQVFGVKS